MSRLHLAEAGSAQFLCTCNRASENRVHFSARCASLSPLSVPLPVMFSWRSFNSSTTRRLPLKAPSASTSCGPSWPPRLRRLRHPAGRRASGRIRADERRAPGLAHRLHRLRRHGRRAARTRRPSSSTGATRCRLREQVDTSVITPVQLADLRCRGVDCREPARGAVLAYDPWLTPSDGAEAAGEGSAARPAAKLVSGGSSTWSM